MPEYPTPITGLPPGRVDVLIVEDERELAEATAEYLDAMGISSHHEPTAEAALDVLSRREAGVVLLDVNLPGDSGFAFCRQLRQASQVPVIFISARGSEDDQVLALSVGGDDYIIKPFSLAVLAAKISRMLSRSGQHTAGFDDGRLRVDDEAGRVWLHDRELRLPTMEDRLLRHLGRHRGRVVTRQELFDEVWGEPFTSDGTLTVHIRRLRRRIEPDPERPTYLKTVWGRGYLFEDTR